MSSIHFGRERVGSFDELVSKYSDDELASPARSTVPLLDYWRDPGPRLEHLLSRFGLAADVPYAQLYFEFPVDVRGGRGKPSYTDLMILTPRCAIAIEAKHREPAYPTVAKWLGESQSVNRLAVLEGWLGAIRSETGCALTVDEVRGVTYQLVHRTASVCCQRRRLKVAMYQVFGDSAPPHYLEQLRDLSARFAEASGVAFRLMQCGFRPTLEYAGLLSAWDAGERQKSNEVRQALRKPLLSFPSVVL